MATSLAEYAARLRAANAAAPKVSPSSNGINCLFLGTFEDKEYIANLKGMFNGLSTWVCTDPLQNLTHLEMYCAKRGITRVVSTSVPILRKLLEGLGNSREVKAVGDYAGSVFTHRNLEIVFISPLKQLFTVSYGKFLAARYISKVTDPNAWAEASTFSWTLITPANLEEAYYELSGAYAIAADIETFKDPLSIRCIGYTGIFLDVHTGSFRTSSYVLPIDSTYNLAWMRKINDLPAQKIFQNGKYDCSYLLRYNAPVRNWIWDTAHAMHCWYSELPKDLAFLNAFFLRKVVYWKDLAETQDLLEYYKYNALDTWATANVWIQWMLNSPDWARRNYSLEFPLVYPCLLAEMTGLRRDTTKLLEARNETDKQATKNLTKLQTILGAKGFNPGSPIQVKNLLILLGCKDITTSNEKDLKKAQLRHPLNNFILELVLTIRGLRKLSSTYLRVEDDAKQTGIHAGEGGAKEFLGRILYALNPHGTDTGRLASREHHFWCGLQIQNIPRGPEVKQTICVEDGFYLGECDLEQAESRDTAHISGDEKLIAAVSGSRDFHSINASSFFGVEYGLIYDDSIKKTKNKPLRDLAKRVNHGANYNMGPNVLIDTMGLDKIWEAQRLLGLSSKWTPKEVAEYLLGAFHATYPRIRSGYYTSVVNEIGLTSRLTSRAFHHLRGGETDDEVTGYIERGDWTRYCFGNPNKNKSDLNSYVAHCPQSLNARTLNEAFLKVFYEIALPFPHDFRLHAQIHDSILFSYTAKGKELAERVRNCMEIPVTVLDVSGTYRTFTVPAALKLGKAGKLATYWSETE